MFNRKHGEKPLVVILVLVLLLSLVMLVGACNDDSDDEAVDYNYKASQSDQSMENSFFSAFPQGVTVSAASGFVASGAQGVMGPAGAAGPMGAPGMEGPPDIVPMPTSIPEPNMDFEMTSGGGLWGVDRMIVRTGDLRLKVVSIQEALDGIKQSVAFLGGYVVSSSYSGQKDDTASISIRVPAGRYDESLMSLRDLALEVFFESTRTNDVTEEYSDLDSQVRNLEVTEARYLELLEKAEKVDDMLKIERMISETRGKIEGLKGRMNYLEKTSDTSLINIQLVEDRPLEVDFEADTIRIGEGSRVSFTNETTGGTAPYGYLWDFGDGNTSTDRNVSFVYDDPGIYSVSLKVTDSKGSGDTQVKTDYITVVGGSGWSAADTADSAWNGLSGIGRGLGSFFIWASILSVFWIPAALLIFGLNRHYKWIQKGKSS